jgi:hypothetical protein
MNLRKLIRECAIEELQQRMQDPYQSSVAPLELQYKQYIFPQLDELKFTPQGSSPNEYREYYSYSFATIQCIIENGTVELHRFYDNEGYSANNIVRKFKLPSPFSEEFSRKIIDACSRLQQSIMRDSSMFGMDEGFDPQSQAGPNSPVDPNCPEDNPYPAINAKMRRMEETTHPN